MHLQLILRLPCKAFSKGAHIAVETLASYPSRGAQTPRHYSPAFSAAAQE